jgi:hypothetical protein
MSIDIDEEMQNYFRASMAEELPVTKVYEDRLRVSGFPFCGLRDLYKRLIDHKTTHTSSGMEFYTGTGTTAHLVYQRWLGAAGRIYGCWKCKSNTCNPESSITVPFGHSNICPKCKGEMEYEEFTVRYGKYSTGHIDGVYKDSEGNYWILDYKTSSVKACRRHKTEPDGVFPYTKNKIQVQSYAALIELEFDIKIKGWILLYVARDDPKICVSVSGLTSSDDKRRILKRIDSYNIQWGRVQSTESYADVQWLIDHKPCKTREYYEQFFGGFKGCPLHTVCFTEQLDHVMKREFKEGKVYLAKDKKRLEAILKKHLPVGQKRIK